MAPPIITLTTDFGLSDHYVGAMKGVILSICPRAQIVDISHEAGAFQISEGAFLIAQAYSWFPKGTVHVIVVDPGVGTSRRPILAEATGHRFIAPDNGVLALILARHKHKVRLISNSKYFVKPVSNTFHGRDVFAPVAAHLASGVPPARIGRLIDDYQRLEPDGRGRVLKIDHFGNVITSFQAADLKSAAFTLKIGKHYVRKLANTYEDSPAGALFAIIGSSGYVEVSMRQASAARKLACKPGAPVDLVLE